jgi:hypothetical protein
MPAEDAREKEPSPGVPQWNRSKNKKAAISGLSAFLNTYRKEQKANRAQEGREDRGKKWREIWTLVFVILTTGGIFYQAYLFRGQLTEMQNSETQTGLLIENNAKLATAAGKQAEAAEKQASAMADSAKAARDNLIAAERAWVGPRNAKIEGAIEVGKPVEVTIEYANTGHEPAQNFFSAVDTFAVTDAEDKNGASLRKMSEYFEKCKNSRNMIVGQVVFPTSGFSTYNLSIKSDPSFITQELLDGEKILVVQGCFLYESFNAFRHTYFCYFYNSKRSKTSNLSICAIGDSAD